MSPHICFKEFNFGGFCGLIRDHTRYFLYGFLGNISSPCISIMVWRCVGILAISKCCVSQTQVCGWSRSKRFECVSQIWKIDMDYQAASF